MKIKILEPFIQIVNSLVKTNTINVAYIHNNKNNKQPETKSYLSELKNDIDNLFKKY